MRKLIFLFLLLAILALLLNPLTGTWIASHYVVDDGVEPADVVVALRSGRYEQQVRFDEALKLVQEHYAPILLLDLDANLVWGHSEAELAEEYLRKRGVPSQQLRHCENHTDSTAEEALAVRDCLQRLGARKVIIVTSEYHTRRSRMIFRRVLSGTGIIPIIHPVYNNFFWDVHWWRKRRWAKTFVDESMKLAWADLEYWFSQHELSPAPKAESPGAL